MIDKDGGQYKHSMNMSNEDHNIAIYIDNNIYYIPHIKSTRFGELISRPKIQDYCKLANIKYLFTGLILENFMGYSTQVPARHTILIEKEIKHKFNYIEQKVASNDELHLFELNQTEYNIYYTLNHYYNHGTEDYNHSLYVYKSLKNKLSDNGTKFHNWRHEVKKDINLDNILKKCNNEIVKKWKSLDNFDYSMFLELNEDDKIAYYLHWTNKKDEIYDKFYDRFYGEYEELDSNNIDKINKKMLELSKTKVRK